MQMHFQSNIVLDALLFVSFMLCNAWEKDNPAAPAVTNNVTQQVNTNLAPALPGSTTSNVASTGVVPPTSQFQAIPVNRTVQVTTNVLEVTIDTVGGNIVGVKLPAYPKALKAKDQPY